MPLRLLTLGAPVELLGADGEPHRFANSKHLALLAYLILERGPHSRDWLTRFIWSSGEPGSMNDALSALRGVLGAGVFPARTKVIAFDPELVECDAHQFIAACNKGADLSIDNVLQLYRGPFLADFNVRGASPRFISWVERKRAEFEQMFLNRCQAELEGLAAKEDGLGIQSLVEAVLRRVPTWPEAEEWLGAAEEIREPKPKQPRQAEEQGATVFISATDVPPPPVLTVTRPPRWQLYALAILSISLITLLIRTRERGVPQAARVPPTVTCRPGEARAQLVEEVFHYGVRVRPGRVFVKRWTLQNTGVCTWPTSFRLHHVSSSGPQLSTAMMDVPLQRIIPPGDTIMFVMPMRAPTKPGMYGEVWELRDSGDRAVAVGNTKRVEAMIRVPLPHYPECRPGEGSGALLVKKFPDGTVIHLGDSVRYSWTLRNNGECAWGDGAALRFISWTHGRLTSIDSVTADRSVEPGETYTFLAPMRAPDHPGVYGETWALRGPAGGILVDGLPVTAMQLRVQADFIPATNAPICQDSAAVLRFVDENWPDSSSVHPGQEFTKRWTVVNGGSCAWRPDFTLEYLSNTNEQLARAAAPKPLGEIVAPGTAYTFDVPMRAPQKPGFYREDWRFVDHHGNLIMIGTSPFLAALIVVTAS
jgi:hypothetical protein